MNNYSFQARVLPMTFALLPIMITGAILSINFAQFTPFLISSGATAALSFFLSQVGRDAGKKKEPKLWESWGGTPSITLLKWSDSNIDVHTKGRYHTKLQSICPLTPSPDRSYEIANPIGCIDCYNSWTAFLISRTRDTKEFKLLFLENINYGYRRNLWGLKPFAVCFVLLCIIATYLDFASRIDSYDPKTFGNTFVVAELLLLIILFIWLLLIKPNWVKTVAFSYAKRLLEATEKL